MRQGAGAARAARGCAWLHVSEALSRHDEGGERAAPPLRGSPPAAPPPPRRRCNDKQQTVVEVQAQLRLGRSDFGVNARRNERFLLELSRAVQEGQLPQMPCVEPDAAGRKAG